MPLNKAEVLAQMELLPLPVLQKLLNYSGNIIIPEEDLLINVTMTQMVNKAMTLADQFFPAWTDRSSADFGRYLVELIGLFSEKDFWYLNAFANESILSKMTVYSDAFTRAVELGYYPVLCKSAQATFDVTFKVGAAFTYAPGQLVVQHLNTGYKFTNIAPFTVPQSVTPLTIPLILFEGNWLNESQSYNGFRVDIRKPFIDVSSIQLVRNSTTWSRVNVFGQSDGSSPHYLALPEEDGKVSIFFGKDGYGLSPVISDLIELSYLQCSGNVVNTLTDTTIINLSQVGRSALTALQLSAASGSYNPESIASIKNNALNYFTTKFAVNNEVSTQRWLNSQVEVKQSKVVIQGSNVFIRVIPVDGTVASVGLLNDLTARITPYITSGYTAFPLSTDYVNTAPIVCDIYFLQGYDSANVVSLCQQYISDYTDPLVLAKYGAAFTLTDIEYLLKSKITGLQNVVFNTIAGNPAANIPVPAYAILQKVSTSDILITPYEVS